MRQLLALLLSSACLLLGQEAAPNQLTSEEAAQGWALLFDGHSLSGWTPVGGAEWKAVDGAIVAESGAYGWLRHDAQLGDFALRLEFRTAADGNSGVLFRALPNGMPHLSGYEVQICDTHERFKTGSIVSHASASPATPIRAGEWQSLEILAIGARMAVKIDGKPVLAIRDGKSRAGHIGLQFSPGKKIEFRSIRVRPVVGPASPGAAPPPGD